MPSWEILCLETCSNWACVIWSFRGLLEAQKWRWKLSHRADASGLTCKPSVTAYIFLGSLGHCPVSQIIIGLNKIFHLRLYKKSHCSHQCSFSSCLQKGKRLVCIRTGMRNKTEEIMPLWKHVKSYSFFFGLMWKVSVIPSHKIALQIWRECREKQQSSQKAWE